MKIHINFFNSYRNNTKSFNDMTNTPFSGSRYPEKWVKYVELMVESYTLPKIAKKLLIHISTAFYWNFERVRKSWL